MRGSCTHLALILAFLTVGCTNPASSSLLVTPILVDNVDVFVGDEVPATVEARVQGVIGDGCSTVHSVTQRRSGSTVIVTILRERPADAVCIQIALMYDERLRLDGVFSRGSYRVLVNDVEREFRVE